MEVPANLKAQVRSVVQDSIVRVQLAYPDLLIPRIRITYIRSYTTAGWAMCADYHVNFDPILVVAYPEEFLKQIVPHEVAHVITEHIHGRRTPGHGKEWKAIMILMGLQPDRCHNLDTSISKRPMTTYKFACGCAEGHEYGSVKTKKILLNTYACLDCSKRLTPLFPIIFHSKMPIKVVMGTKMDKARWIICRNKARTRKTIIRKLMEVAGLSPAGARTYYHQLTK